MRNNAVLRAANVLKALDLRGVMRALDLGGGPGTYGIELAKRGIEVTLFDLPDTVEIAREMIQKAGVKNITCRGGDFHFDDIGKGYDLVLLSQVLHSHGPLESLALLGKVCDALNPQGTIAIHEFALAEDRASPVLGALFSVNMLVNTAEGRSYTAREMKGWLSKTGFGRIKVTDLDGTVMLTGRKG
jgi:2-polyprenyl-3-methyl-5-hydroxy-6-metoxy-1,4-benzoquinol methylase